MIESVGERLKKIRLEKGLSLEEAQKKTKIQMSILKAMEGDSLTSLSQVYLKSFLKIYCKFLGVDPKDFIPDYKDTQTQVIAKISDEDVKEKPNKLSAFFENVQEKIGSFRPNKKVKAALIAVIAVAILSLGLFNLGKIIFSKRSVSSSQLKPAKAGAVKAQTKDVPVLEKGKTVATQKAKPQEAKSPPKEAQSIASSSGKKESNSGIRLVISARENCLIRLKVDGRVVFNRVLEKGRSESWHANDKMELFLGNAAAVELQVNAQRFANLGRKGQALKNIVITEKEGLKILR